MENQEDTSKTAGEQASNEPAKPADPPKPVIATPNEINALRRFIEATAKEYSEKGRRNKRGAIIVQILLVCLSALTTIFLGWKFENDYKSIFLLNLSLICSSVVSGINVILAFFDYKELWAQYKVSRNKLKVLSCELDYLQASRPEGVTKKLVDEIFDRYVKVCEDTNQTYHQLRMAKDGTEKK